MSAPPSVETSPGGEQDTLVSVGIVVNELVTNAMKYAFENIVDREGVLRIEAHRRNGAIEISVVDNGPGFVDSKNHHGGFGLQLLEAMAQQVRGEMTYDADDGMRVTLRFTSVNSLSAPVGV